jgi:hypothetical protein
MPSQTTEKRSLIYNASNLSTFEDNSEYRNARREAMRGVSSRERLKKCGVVPYGAVTLSIAGGIVRQRGLTTCGSVWGCPVCSAKILTKRSLEVEEAMNAWVKAGGYFIFETFTLSHRLGDSVAKQRLGLQVGWTALNAGSFKNNHIKAGRHGYLKMTEPTFGSNGFHLHIHALYFMKGELSQSDQDKWTNKNFNKWQKSVASAGFAAPDPKGHKAIRVHNYEGLQGYFTKGFDNPSLNNPGNKANSVWNLLSKAIEHPKSTHTFAWRTWEAESKGMRQITWSKDLRRGLGLDEELEDEEIADEPVPLLEIDPQDVARYGHSGKYQSVIRRHLASGDLSAAETVLDQLGIRYRKLYTSLLTPSKEGYGLPQPILNSDEGLGTATTISK